MNSIKTDIDLARKQSLFDAVKLLQMALLDLQMKLHKITDKELRCFADHLERNMPSTPARGLKHGNENVLVLPIKVRRSNSGRKM